MTRYLDSKLEERQERFKSEVLSAVYGGLVDDVGRSGALLTGFSVKLGSAETLLTLRGVLAGRDQVSFVVSDDLPSVLAKTTRLARQDKLRWRASKF